MSSSVTYQFTFCNGDNSGGSGDDRSAPSNPASFRASARGGNEGFPRFSRLRLANGFKDLQSKRTVTRATATPTRPLPMANGSPAYSDGHDIDVTGRLDDQHAVALDHDSLNAYGTLVNEMPTKIVIIVSHTNIDGSDPKDTNLVIDKSILLGDPEENFISEIDVELTRTGAVTVKLGATISYQLNGVTVRATVSPAFESVLPPSP